MSESRQQLDRRDFLRGSLTVGAGAMGIASDGPHGAAGSSVLPTVEQRARRFLSEFVEGWLPLETAADEANWAASTDVSEAHTAAQVARNLAVNRYVGAPEVIDTVRRLLEPQGRAHRPDRSASSRRSGSAPPRRRGPIPEVVKARAEAEAKQSAAAGRVRLPHPPWRPARLPPRPTTSTASWSSRATWTSAAPPGRRPRTIGRPLREGLLRLRDLRNKVARAMGFDNFFALQVADYGMTVPEMLALCDRLIAEMKPLYRQLHAWARACAGEALQGRGPARRQDPRPLAPQPMGPELARPGRRDRHGRPLQGQAAGVHHRAGRAVLCLARVPPAAEVVLGEVRPLSGRPEVGPQEEQPRQRLAHRPARRRPQPDVDRAQQPMVHHGAPRAGAYLLLHQLFDARGAVPAPRRGEPRLPRGDRRPDRPGGRAAAVSQAGRAAEPRGREGRRGDVPARHGARRRLGGLPALVGRRDDPLRARLLRRQDLRRVRSTPRGGRWSASTRGSRRRANGPRCSATPRPRRTSTTTRRSTTTTRSPRRSSSSSTTTSRGRSSSRTRGSATITATSGSATSSAASSRLGATRDWNAVLREATGEGLSARAMVAYFAPLAEWLERENRGRAVGWS